MNFTPLTFCVSRDLKFSQSELQAAELNTKSQMKSSPKLGPFFTSNLNRGICSPLMWLLEAHY